MKRLEKVYQQLVNNWENVNEEIILEEQGSSATELAETLGITRANASLELNNLVRQKRAIKIKSYPVRYFPISVLEGLANCRLRLSTYEVSKIQEVLISKAHTPLVVRNPFELMIGQNGSLKKAVSQAKAAVHYPPNGLHMLLLGPTGSGKTFFANKVYQYAMFEKLLSNDAPFESFNCADYYHNPQLLLAQLFGYIEGAYTGANVGKAGLVEKADGGILLLDEIHRLTPEGQEMLFYFIDHGRFNRLGETGFSRKANVLIICATTEDPNSSLLETFLRRIPMTIQIPSLNERSVKEKIELAKFLFEKEAKRVKRTFLVNIDVMDALIQTVAYGNVGQMQSQIQLICAQAFLHGLHEANEITIGIHDMPEELMGTWRSSSQTFQRSKELEELLDITTRIDPVERLEQDDDETNGFNIYETIEEKVKILEGEGIGEDQIHQYILTDLHLHVRNFVNNQQINYNLLKFMDPKISTLTIELKKIAEEALQNRFDRKFLYYIGMHLDSYFRREKEEKRLSQMDIREMKTEHQREYYVARLFKYKIEEVLSIQFPEIEVIYLTMLLVSIESLEEKERVNILVIAHGNATATSMVQVATELLGSAPIYALNMPLTITPDEMKQKILLQLGEMDGAPGILLLVDMGSLAMMEEVLIKESGKKIKTIPNVTTSMVLDAVRKINYTDLGLIGIYSSIVKDFLSSVQLQMQQGGREKAILSICTTGSGTAAKIEKMVAEIIEQGADETIRTITLSSIGLQEQLPAIVDKYHILATVGTTNPKIDAPHITLEELIEGTGEKILRKIVGGPMLKEKRSKRKNVVVKDLCQDTLNMYLVYLNPYLLSNMLLDWTKELQVKMQKEFSNTLLLKLVVHTAFAFERVVKQNPLGYHDVASSEVQQLVKIVTETLAPLEKQLLLELTDDEKFYIAEVIAAD